MFVYIKGTLEVKNNGYVIVESGFIGYKIFMSDNSIENLGELGKQVKIHTYFRVREDDVSIFGFNTAEELRMFELMLSVSGVGAKLALGMLAVIEPSEFALAVISNDVSKLVQIPGIGNKSAQRIVLELKDKLKKEEGIGKVESKKIKEKIESNNIISEALTALQVLGYNKKEIEKAFEKINKDNITVESLIKQGLQELSSKK